MAVATIKQLGANVHMTNPVSSELMNEILNELNSTFPKGIKYNGVTKKDEVITFEFSADSKKAGIYYNEPTSTFIPINSDCPNSYKFKVDLKELIFNKDGYLQVLQDYLILMMGLESQFHFGYFVYGFRFVGSKSFLVYSFAPDPDIEVDVDVEERTEEVVDSVQKDIIIYLKKLFESSLTKSTALLPDSKSFGNLALPLLSQQITYEISKKSGEITDMPILYFESKELNPLFNSKKVIALVIDDFAFNIQKAVKLKMKTYFV